MDYYYDQANQLPLTKTAFQKEVYSQVLQNTLKRVERSFQNFFKGAGIRDFKDEIGIIHSHIPVAV